MAARRWDGCVALAWMGVVVRPGLHLLVTMSVMDGWCQGGKMDRHEKPNKTATTRSYKTVGLLSAGQIVPYRETPFFNILSVTILYFRKIIVRK